MKLNFSYTFDVEKAYIIRIDGHAKSEQLAKRCADSCDKVGMGFEFWDAYDGTSGVIKAPTHHGQVMNMIKVTDRYLTRGEVACALSHISLWAKCVEDDKPLVVLEHDAIMLQKYEKHQVFNSISFLGSKEQVKQGWGVFPTPPHAADGNNKHFMCRAHAYSIDPAVAKNMLAHVIKYGINDPLDIMLRADIFPMHQIGVYAFDDDDGTTIANRSMESRSAKHNDNLEF